SRPRRRSPLGARVRDLRAEHRLGDGRRPRGHPGLRREAAGGVQGALTGSSMAVGAGHALALGFAGTVIPDNVIALAEQSGLGGVILFARNCPSLETVLALTTAARRLGPDALVMVYHERGAPVSAGSRRSLEPVLALTPAARRLGPDVLVMVDHEGGRVHRLPAPFTRFPPAASVGRSGDPQLVAAVARAMARELRAAGF